MEGIIYRYKSPNGKYYIGQTTNEPERRRKFLGKSKVYAGPEINRARKKYGAENFEYDILVRVESDSVDELKSTLNQLEIGFISLYDSYNNGYNETIGGGATKGHKMSDAARQRISEAHKGKTSWNKGISMDDETKKKISDAKKGIKHFGHKHSDETKMKIANAHKGMTYLKGKPKSEEHKKHLSDARKCLHRVYEADGIHYHYEKTN